MEEALSNQHSAFSQNPTQKQNQHRGPFTAKDAEGAEEDKTLSLMNADDTGPRGPRVSGTAQQRAEALVRKIGETCDELETLAEENPELVGRVTRGSEEHKDAYMRLKARLELADAAPRCRWVRQDGTSCGSPQLKKHIYCFAHVQMMEARALALSLPALEDANAIQIGIMRIQKALIEGTISTKTAGLLLYSMQLALQNVGQTTFGQAKAEEPVRETVSEEEAIRRDLFTTEDTKDTEGIGTSGHRDIGSSEKGLPLMNDDDTDKEEHLPRMNADGRGLGNGRTEVEWRPTPDMYRMDTREGMEAYEAMFRMKIRTSSDRKSQTLPLMNADGTDQEAQKAEVRANLG